MYIDGILLLKTIQSVIRSATFFPFQASLLSETLRSAQLIVSISLPDRKGAVGTVTGKTDIQRKANLEEELNEIWAAIKRLPYAEQRMMQMRYSQGFADGEIAERLGISPEDVRRCVNRARAYIKESVYPK